MDGRSRLDRYQNLRSGMNSRNENPSNSRATVDNSFESTNAYGGFNQNNFQPANTQNNRYQTSEYDSLLKEHEDFLKSLDSQLESMHQDSSFNASVIRNNPSQTPDYASRSRAANSTNAYAPIQEPAYQNPYSAPAQNANPYQQPNYNTVPQQNVNPYAQQPSYNPAPVQNVNPYAQPQYSQSNDSGADFYSLPSSFNQNVTLNQNNPYANNSYSQPNMANPADNQYYQQPSYQQQPIQNTPIQPISNAYAAPAQPSYINEPVNPQQQQMAASMAVPFSDIRAINKDFAQAEPAPQPYSQPAPVQPVETTNDFGLDLVNNSQSEPIVPSAFKNNTTIQEPHAEKAPVVPQINIEYNAPQPQQPEQPATAVQPQSYTTYNAPQPAPVHPMAAPSMNQPQSYSMPQPKAAVQPAPIAQPQSYTIPQPIQQAQPIQPATPAPVVEPTPIVEPIRASEPVNTQPAFVIDDEPQAEETPVIVEEKPAEKPKEDFSIDDISELVGNMSNDIVEETPADDQEIIMDKTATYDEFDSYINDVLNEFTKDEEETPQPQPERVSLEEKAPELFANENNDNNIDEITKEISGWNYHGPEMDVETNFAEPQTQPQFDLSGDIEPKNAIAQPVYYDDPANVADLTQNLAKEKALNDELLEKTRALDYTISEYENELNDADQSMSKTNRILNFVLTALILTLLVILFIIGYWFIKERGISL